MILVFHPQYRIEVVISRLYYCFHDRVNSLKCCMQEDLLQKPAVLAELILFSYHLTAAYTHSVSHTHTHAHAHTPVSNQNPPMDYIRLNKI
jgi:hypothetical protein